MRLRDETPLTPEAAAELAALEAALSGAPVAPEHADLAELALALRDDRPRPADEFARSLDKRAATSFPREAAGAAGWRRGFTTGPWRGALEPSSWRRVLDAHPRRWIPVAGVAASIAVATTLALSLSGTDRGGSASDGALIGAAPTATTQSGGQATTNSAPTTSDPVAPGASGSGAPGVGGSGAAEGRETAPPVIADSAVPQASSDSAAKSAPPVQTAPTTTSPDEQSRLGQALPTPSAPSTSVSRSVERGATLRLATTPRRLDDVAGRVVGVVDGVGGFVRSSAVDSRPGLGGGATFELQIPVRRLSTALARLSALASVRSRNDSSLDVTEQVTQARDRVGGLKAERRSLLKQLERATSLDETARLRARLRSVEARLGRATSVRAQLRQRTTYSAVLVEIVTEKQRGAAAGPWTPRDALGDAGRVLEFAAGVALVALAVLLPVALLALIAWPIGRAIQRRRREGVLDAPGAAAGAGAAG